MGLAHPPPAPTESASSRTVVRALLFLILAIGSQWLLGRIADRGNIGLKSLLGEYGFSLYLMPVLRAVLLVLLTHGFLAVGEGRRFVDVGFNRDQRYQFWNGLWAGFLPGLVLMLPLVSMGVVEAHSAPSMVIRGVVFVPIYALSWMLVDAGYALRTLSRRFAAPVAIGIVAACSNALMLFSHPKSWSTADFSVSLIHGFLATAVVGLAAVRGKTAWLPTGLAVGLMLASGSGLGYFDWSASARQVLTSYTVWSFWGGVPAILLLVASGVLVRRMSLEKERPLSAFYPAALTVSLGLAAMLGVQFTYKFVAQPTSPDANLARAATLLILVAGLVLSVFLYKAWLAIQDGHTRISPGRAVGFLFIPFFNIYWFFRAIWGYSVEYNRYIARNSIVAPRMPEALFLACCILALTTWIPIIGSLTGLATVALMLIAVSKMRGGVNALTVASRSALTPTARGTQPDTHYATAAVGGTVAAALASTLTSDRAAAILGVPADASAGLVRDAYNKIFPEFRLRYTNAISPDQSAKFANELALLREAAEVLHPGVTGEPDLELPKIGPTIAVPPASPTTSMQTPARLADSGIPRSTVIMAAAAVVLAMVSAFFAVQWQKKPKFLSLQPSGPIVQVPAAVLFQGGAGEAEPTTITTDQIIRAQRALNLHPHDPKVLNDAGSLFAGIGQLTAGHRFLQEAELQAPDDPIINYNYARSLYQQGNVVEATRYADAAIRLRSDFDEARLLRAATAVQQGDYETAEQQILKLVNKGLAIALVTNGVIQLSKGKVKDALASFQGALNLAPNNATALYDSGVANQTQRNFPAAEDFYRKAIASDRGLAEAHNNLGTILAGNGNERAAFDEFKQASFLKPDDKTFKEHASALAMRVSASSGTATAQQGAAGSGAATPEGYSQLPAADRTEVGLGGAGAGTMTVTNNSEHVLEMTFTGPTTVTAIIPAYLSKTVMLPEGQYKVVGRAPSAPRIRPFYGSDFYRATEKYSLELQVYTVPNP